MAEKEEGSVTRSLNKEPPIVSISNPTSSLAIGATTIQDSGAQEDLTNNCHPESNSSCSQESIHSDDSVSSDDLSQLCEEMSSASCASSEVDENELTGIRLFRKASLSNISGVSSSGSLSVNKSDESFRKRRIVKGLFSCLLIIVISSLVYAGVFLGIVFLTGYLHRREHESSVASFQRTFKDSLDVYLGTLSSLKSVFQAFGDSGVTQEDFAHLVLSLDVPASGIQALEWVPRVVDDNRAQFVERMRKTSFIHNVADGVNAWEDFEIFKKSSENGSSIPNVGEPEYFPVTLVYPISGNEAAIGFDLRSNSIRRASLEKAFEEGNAVATSKIKLVQETGNSAGFLVFDPVYSMSECRYNFEKADIEEKEKCFIGFSLGVFRVVDIVSKAKESHPESDLIILDQNNDVLYNDPTTVLPEHTEHLHMTDFASTNPTWTYSTFDVAVCDRLWTFILIPTDISTKKYTIANFISHPCVLVVFILLNFLLILIYILREKRKAVQIKYEKSVVLHMERRGRLLLLERILPAKYIQKMGDEGKGVFVEQRKTASVSFIDIQDFTTFCDCNKPVKVLLFLNSFFSRVDSVTERFPAVHKVKSIGDGYLSAAGLFGDERPIEENTIWMIKFCAEVLKKMGLVMGAIGKGVRIGVHSGSVLSGVGGTVTPMFDIWGNCVNMASRLESSGVQGKIQVVEAVKKMLQNQENLMFEKREGLVHLKGKGKFQTYYVTERLVFGEPNSSLKIH